MQAYKYLKPRCIAKRSHHAQPRVTSPSHIFLRGLYRSPVRAHSNRYHRGFHTITQSRNKFREIASDDRVLSGPVEFVEEIFPSKSDLKENTLRLRGNPQWKNNVTGPNTEENTLQEISKLAHRGSAIRFQLGKLILQQEIKPQLPQYEAWLLENCSPEHGSASNIGSLLKEAMEEKIPLGKTIFAAALKGLAIHPDPTLLAKVLDLCATNWIVLDNEMRCLVAASYIRSDQIELAQEQIQQLSKDKEVFQPWLHVLLLEALVHRQDWESVIRTCYDLQDDYMRHFDIPHNFWKWLLEQATAAQESWIVKWVWNLWVERMWIEPEEDTIHGVLSIAVEKGLPVLAESAVSVLKHKVREKGDWIGASKAAYSIEKAYEAAELQKPPKKAQNLKRGGIMWKVFPDAGRGLGSPRLDPWAALDTQFEAGIPYAKTLRDRTEHIKFIEEGRKADDE